jgi:cellulose synthase/poly-beta-1,6-N-acetylglucosamine synthase-like glycosyltransferase
MLDALVTTGLGAALLIGRLFPRTGDAPGETKALREKEGLSPKVSIIIPARNEEKSLPELLPSLISLDHPDVEIIVVDDHSEDQTATVAKSFAGIRVLHGAPRPAEWTGKNWACHQGGLLAQGDYLLFTDADTIHRRDSLKRAIDTMAKERCDLLTCLPYHRAYTWWEKLLGPFQMLLLAMTAPYGQPKPRRVFAIGQYLLFDRIKYREFGGHEAIKGELVDDLALARTVLVQRGHHHVYRGAPLFEVRMYDSLRAFIAGWRRNFRLGFAYSHPLSGLEATLMIMAITGAGHLGTSPWITTVCAVCIVFMLWRQRSLGDFTPWGVLLLPFSLGLFCITASLALVDLLCGSELKWKGRKYDTNGQIAQALND